MMSYKLRDRMYSAYNPPPALKFEEPRYLMSRIVVSNIDDRVIRETLEDKFSRYGRVLGVSMHRGFAYVQFESETSAYSAIKSENDTVFSGNKIDVRLVKDSRKDEKPRFLPVQAGRRRTSPPRRDSNSLRDNYSRSSFRDRSPSRDDYSSRSRSPNDRSSKGRSEENRDSSKVTNDCEIIALDKELRTFAEIIEWKLKGEGMHVDILFPRADSKLLDILEDIATRGCMYAVVISPENELHKSLTVFMLGDNTQEHRNMPMNDALQLLSNHFKHELKAKEFGKPVEQQQPQQLPARNTEDVQKLLRLLAEGKQITLPELDDVIHHLQEYKEFLMANAIPQEPIIPQKQIHNTQFQGSMTQDSHGLPNEKDVVKTLLNLIGNNPSTLSGVLNPHQPRIGGGSEDSYSSQALDNRDSWGSRSFNNSSILQSQNISLSNPIIKNPLESLIQGGGSQLLQNSSDSPAVPSRNMSFMSGTGQSQFYGGVPPQQQFSQGGNFNQPNMMMRGGMSGHSSQPNTFNRPFY